MGLFWTILALLVAVAGVLYRERLKRDRPTVSDDMISQIEASGWVEVDEPLDLDEARDAEEEFWEEEWDEPEPW